MLLYTYLHHRLLVVPPDTPLQAEKAKGEAAERQREMDGRRETARIARQR